MVQYQDQKRPPEQYKMGAASPEDTLITEKDTEKALETERERNHRNVVNESVTSPHEDTSISGTQDQPPSQQVVAIRQRIWSEDARHARRVSTLHQQAQSEQERHATKDRTFRSRLIELANKPRERLRISPSKSLANPKTRNNNSGQGEMRQQESKVAKWLDGLRSISSISEFWGSSDESSSVEVVAAKDAVGRGKGMRIVSDGVEESSAAVFYNVFRAGKAKSN
ncbi:hypothetical protein D6C85_04393 [Aureobasidium pullulans]|uniref:Uncharacterized protein n=1 Tax=Aureobasidium pullulans TaxID=5580 RepID=A0A4S9Z8L8_AURPU|nr:hypothetical protein D6D26_09975 [Aureobasidium pullulans]THW63393.1 hypothetical protein D6D20_03628 [Aureobasidium pullulans]THZ72950.1 hypothetical protein D6C85_04393 [Aureobasidium pullulans]TIA00922.1 hypothetical protein D6C82_04230 [Aureobasidium pullulans]